MKFNFQKYCLNALLMLSLSTVALTSCVDEKLENPAEKDPGADSIDMTYDGFSVGFSVSMDAVQSGRASSDFDDYVDTKDKFRLFFFDKYGRFLFEAIDRTVTPLGLDDYGRKKFFVRIPLNYVVDREGHSFDVNKIKDQLRDDDFKIAVLANWPNQAVSSGSSSEDEDGEDDDDNNVESDVTVVKGEPNWGLADSYLNPEATATSVKNINDLHHLVADGNYNGTSTGTRPQKQDVYDFVMENGMMGVKTDWVKNREFSNKDAAESYIINDWNPADKDGEQLTGRPHYTNLRYLWNLAAAVNYKPENPEDPEPDWNYPDCNKYFDSKEKWVTAWVNRNMLDLSKWLAKDLGGTGEKFIDGKDDAKFTYYPIEGAEKYEDSNDDTKSGIKLPIGSVDFKTNSDNVCYGVLRFTAKASGTVRITATAPFGNAALQVYRNREGSGAKSGSVLYWNSNDSKTQTYDVSVSGNEEDVYIYCINKTNNDITYNSPIVINRIEYLKTTYLYESDREGKLPSAEFPIPMYGVENFQNLGELWQEGTTFDLSNVSSSINSSNDYDNKDIYLIRSLAKIEVYLPEKAEFVYMRSMNRTARCEPMDVETPTSETWVNEVGDMSHTSNSSSQNCEWFTIKKYRLGYSGRTNDSGDDIEKKNKEELDNYTNWLAWYYGSWASASWNVTETNGTVTATGWDFDAHNKSYYSTNTVTIDSEEKSGKYPHVYNPDINRSGFAAFYYEGATANGHKYVLYMPEKNVEDPNYPGITSSIPKVAHIEYRYDTNHQDNLDDDYCYRIYFADTAPTEFKYDEYETAFEQQLHKQSISSKYGMWPIMRNHIYSFYVTPGGGSAPTTMEVRVRVTDWGYNKIENNLW